MIQFLSHQMLLFLILQNIMTSILLFEKVNVSVNPHFPFLTLSICDHLSVASRYMIASLDAISITKILKDTLNHPGWHDAMLEEIHASYETLHIW